MKGKPRQQMNVELRTMFDKPSAAEAEELEALLPSVLIRAIEGED